MCDKGELQCENDPCMVDEDVIARVNGNQQLYGWTATNYSMFWGRKASEGLVYKTGTLNPEELVRHFSFWSHVVSVKLTCKH